MATNKQPNNSQPTLTANSYDMRTSDTSTLYGTIPLHTHSQFSFKEHVHLSLPRNASQVDPTVVQLLRPYL